jgi:hypothetical protein
VNALASNTSLHQLVERYPFLVEFLAGYNKKFELLQNPIMRATVGRAATLGRVAEMGGISVEALIRDIAREVRDRTGDAFPAEAGGEEGGRAAATRPLPPRGQPEPRGRPPPRRRPGPPTGPLHPGPTEPPA